MSIYCMFILVYIVIDSWDNYADNNVLLNRDNVTLIFQTLCELFTQLGPSEPQWTETHGRPYSSIFPLIII